ncbi:LADA_0A08108g1_1 [Lachancea dasiensis]|uniref:LADA_0A08108g1_1 n=1 Tax=Lachancea dasiensis TaxID=1072105 RepID=A0A1G4IQ69_9SACH|nr:LADA_0A08108g1_1 [Lachancea dasiensis]
MEPIQKLHKFRCGVQDSYEFLPSTEELLEASSSLASHHNDLTEEEVVNTVKCLSYYCLNSTYTIELRKKVLDDIKRATNKERLSTIVHDLRAMLMQIKREKISAQGRLKSEETFMLKPQRGFSFTDDKVRSEWAAQGGKRSIPLFYVVLGQLEHGEISSNLWWITPGILNILDDTSELEGIKLQGVVLLRQFLTQTVDVTHTAQFNFAGSGLFKLFEPILLSLWYHFPPSTDPELSGKIWETVSSTLLALYQVQFAYDPTQYHRFVHKFLSETILQATLPRIAVEYTDLTVKVLKIVDSTIDILGPKSVAHMQRLIYVIGEHLVRNAFVTLFMPLVHQITATLTKVVIACPEERVAAHKYDFLGCVLILSEKCHSEGTLDDKTALSFHEFVLLLKSRGCEWEQEEREQLSGKLSWGKLNI